MHCSLLHFQANLARGPLAHCPGSGCPRLESFLDHTDLRAPGPRPHVDLLTGLRFGSQMPHFSLDPSLCLVLLGCYTLLWTPPHPTPFCQPADPRLPRKWQQSLLECAAVAVLPLALCWAGR